jgi:hypothetical protein
VARERVINASDNISVGVLEEEKPLEVLRCGRRQ